jgi:hypothetical protein
MLSNGDGTGFVPSVEEILAYKERPPILATIHLVDGNVITEDLPITPDLNVGKVLEMCSGWLDLKDSRVDSLGMFVYDCGETEDAASMDESYKNAPYRDLIRTPRPLRNDDYMGDIIVQVCVVYIFYLISYLFTLLLYYYLTLPFFFFLLARKTTTQVQVRHQAKDFLTTT